MKFRMHFSGKNESLFRRPSLGAALGIGLVFFALQLTAVGQRNATEDEVKAAYLLNFARLAEWPSTALPNGPAPLVIGVSGGGEEFLDALKAVVAGKIIGTHLLVVRSVSSEKDMKSCHIVFFRASERKRTQAAIEGLEQVGVLGG